MTTLSRETRVASGRLKTVWRSSRLGARYLVEGTAQRCLSTKAFTP